MHIPSLIQGRHTGQINHGLCSAHKRRLGSTPMYEFIMSFARWIYLTSPFYLPLPNSTNLNTAMLDA
jgi:hypothetical protein